MADLRRQFGVTLIEMIIVLGVSITHIQKRIQGRRSLALVRA